MTLSAAEAGEGTSTTLSGTLVVTLAASVAAREMLVVCVAADNAGSSGVASVASVTDSQGNSYRVSSIRNKDTASAANDSGTAAVFAAVLDTALASGVDTVTIAFSPDTYAKAAVLWKVTCASLSYEFPAGTTNDGYGATGGWSGLTVTQDDLVIGVVAFETDDTTIQRDTDTQYGTWSDPIHQATADRGSSTSSQTVSSQWKVPSATGTQQYANVTDVSHDWEAVAFVVRESTTPEAVIAVTLGGLTVAMTATVSGAATVEATPVAVELGGLAVAMTATVEVPVEATPVAVALGGLAVAATATVITSATVEATPVAVALGGLAVAATATAAAAATVIDATIACLLGGLTMAMAGELASSGASSTLAVMVTHGSTLTITEID